MLKNIKKMVNYIKDHHSWQTYLFSIMEAIFMTLQFYLYLLLPMLSQDQAHVSKNLQIPNSYEILRLIFNYEIQSPRTPLNLLLVFYWGNSINWPSYLYCFFSWSSLVRAWGGIVDNTIICWTYKFGPSKQGILVFKCLSPL